MTEAQITLAKALGSCRFLPASADKRFVRDMEARAGAQKPEALTEKQAAYLHGLSWKYRRQLPAALVPAVKPA